MTIMLKSVKNKHYSCEIEAKFIQDRISLAERYVGELCQALSAYSRKAARLRDKGDELAKVCLDYSGTEDINKSLSGCLANFAVSLSSINDYGNLRVQMLNNKVVNAFAQYDTICKHAKVEVKQIFAVREKELMKRRQLDRIKDRNTNRQQVLQAETELVKATAEVSRSIHFLEEQTLTFEKQKLHDIKYIFLDFISTEMGYHAKALEILTKAYKDMEGINEESDLQDFQNEVGIMETEFKKSLRMPDKTSDTKRSLFRASQSLGSITSIFSGTTRKKSPDVPQSSTSKKLEGSKSEDGLNSKVNFESEESESDDDTTETSKSAEPVSPFIAKRYLK